MISNLGFGEAKTEPGIKTFLKSPSVAGGSHETAIPMATRPREFKDQRLETACVCVCVCVSLFLCVYVEIILE